MLSTKIDFAFCFVVNRSNPNGDPGKEGRPRTAEIDGKIYGEVSQVGLKRKMRDRLMEQNVPIFVQSDYNKKDEYTSLHKRATGILGSKLSKSEFAEKACKEWFDVRAFGQLFPFPSKSQKEDGEDSDAVSVGVRGCVTISPCFSVCELNEEDISITKSVNGCDPKKEGEMSSDRMGTIYRINKTAVYAAYGSINAVLSKKTGFSDSDAEALKNAIINLFVNDESACRPAGTMKVLKLVWVKHNSINGKHNTYDVHKGIKFTNDVNNVLDLTKLPDLDYEIIG